MHFPSFHYSREADDQLVVHMTDNTQLLKSHSFSSFHICQLSTLSSLPCVHVLSHWSRFPHLWLLVVALGDIIVSNIHKTHLCFLFSGFAAKDLRDREQLSVGGQLYPFCTLGENKWCGMTCEVERRFNAYRKWEVFIHSWIMKNLKNKARVQRV